MNYKEKVIVITGSSQGIGKAIAASFVRKGGNIVLNGRFPERLEKTKEELQQINLHSAVISVCSDVSTPEGGKKLIEETILHFGRIDILINNVGVSMRGNTADLDPIVFKTIFDSNVLGSVNPTIPAIPYLRASSGSLVFISSLAGIRGLPGLSAYCSSKMALRAIAESIRLEEAEHNLHVGLVYVGMTEIEHNKETIDANGQKKILAKRKKGTVHSMQEVAEVVLKNIQNRKFISVMSGIGKINAFLQPRFPLLVEKIILRNKDKFDERSQ
jgi:NADP-dependent 3-hydroxy acid dehydrogenase YdfG